MAHTYLDITIEEDSICTQQPDPDDSWDRGSYRNELTNLHVKHVSFPDEYSAYNRSLMPNAPPIGTTVYVLIERITEGDTFGQTTGCHRFESWYLTKQEAEARSLVAPKDSDFFGGHDTWEIHEAKVQGPT